MIRSIRYLKPYYIYYNATIPKLFIRYTSILFVFYQAKVAAQFQTQHNGFRYRANPLYLIIALSIATFIVIVIYIILRLFCKPDPRVDTPDGPGQPATVGLDPSVLETFPILKNTEVAAHRADKGPVDCPVCLGSFDEADDDGEKLLLRLLPECNHIFHVNCVDPWLMDHSTCPLCRTNLVPGSESESSKLTHRPDSSHQAP